MAWNGKETNERKHLFFATAVNAANQKQETVRHYSNGGFHRAAFDGKKKGPYRDLLGQV